MGAGKSSSAIWHINHSEDRFLYCTPYLTEVDRILKECSAKRFSQPMSGKSGKGGKKYSLVNLMRERRNIATTHALFGQLDERIEDDDEQIVVSPEIIGLAKEGEYSLVIDEAYDVIQDADLNDRDIEMMMDAGLIGIARDNNQLYVTEAGEEYAAVGRNHKKDLENIRKHTIIAHGKGKFSSLIYPPEIFGAFKDVYILTYMFDGSVMQSYFNMNGLDYKRIGVKHLDDHYEFFDGETEIPDYVLGIRDKIYVYDDQRLNDIGRLPWTLSDSWYDKHDDDAGSGMVRRNTRTFIRKCMVGLDESSEKDYIMWTVYKKYCGSIIERYVTKKTFVSVGTKATNMYADRKYLAFLVNMFMNPNLKHTFEKMGVSYNEDNYALSSLVQWVWRSAIRNGEPIKIYIPSKRMRELFIGWLDDITAQAAAQRVELAGV